jgi:hypothetical protein
MTMYQNLLDEVTQWRKTEGLKIQPPASEQQIELLRRRAAAELDYQIPEHYVGFLRVLNGLNSNGLVLYASETTPMAGREGKVIEGLVEANLLWRDAPSHQSFVFFGEGNISRYAFNQAQSEYQVLDFQTDTLVDSVSSLEQLLAVALREHRP